MFNKAISGHGQPRYVSSDNDPLLNYHQWRANLRIFEIEEIKTVPYVPMSHPVVERLIGTIRREFLDQVLFWSSNDLERKLSKFKDYYNHCRTHSAPPSDAPALSAGDNDARKTSLANYCCQSHCRGPFLHTCTYYEYEFAMDRSALGFPSHRQYCRFCDNRREEVFRETPSDWTSSVVLSLDQTGWLFQWQILDITLDRRTI